MDKQSDDGTKSMSHLRRKTKRLIVCLLIAFAVIAALGWMLSSAQKENERLREENTLLREQLTTRSIKLPFGL